MNIDDKDNSTKDIRASVCFVQDEGVRAEDGTGAGLGGDGRAGQDHPGHPYIDKLRHSLSNSVITQGRSTEEMEHDGGYRVHGEGGVDHHEGNDLRGEERELYRHAAGLVHVRGQAEPARGGSGRKKRKAIRIYSEIEPGLVQQKITSFLNKFPGLAKAEQGKKLNNFTLNSNIPGARGLQVSETAIKQTNKRKIHCGGGSAGVVPANQMGQGLAKRIKR